MSTSLIVSASAKISVLKKTKQVLLHTTSQQKTTYHRDRIPPKDLRSQTIVPISRYWDRIPPKDLRSQAILPIFVQIYIKLLYLMNLLRLIQDQPKTLTVILFILTPMPVRHSMVPVSSTEVITLPSFTEENRMEKWLHQGSSPVQSYCVSQPRLIACPHGHLM